MSQLWKIKNRGKKCYVAIAEVEVSNDGSKDQEKGIYIERTGCSEEIR